MYFRVSEVGGRRFCVECNRSETDLDAKLHLNGIPTFPPRQSWGAVNAPPFPTRRPRALKRDPDLGRLNLGGRQR